jgi:hypothetical protein
MTRPEKTSTVSTKGWSKKGVDWSNRTSFRSKNLFRDEPEAFSSLDVRTNRHQPRELFLMRGLAVNTALRQKHMSGGLLWAIVGAR